MGSVFSRATPVIDGLGLGAPASVGYSDSRRSYDRLEQLLRGSVATYRPSSTDLVPQLVAGYFLGASPARLLELYEILAPKAEAWPDDDPIADSLGLESLSECWGRREMEGRYFEYFRDCLTEDHDWPDVVARHMPLVIARLRGSGDWRPLVLLSHALEADNPMTAVSALAAASVASVPNNMAQMPSECAQEIDLRELVEEAALKRQSSLLIVCHAMCEILLSTRAQLIPSDLQQPLLTQLKTDLDASPSRPRPSLADADPPMGWPELAARALEEPDKLCQTRAALFASVFLQEDLRTCAL